MPMRPAAFTSVTRYIDSRIDLSAFRSPEVAVDFDWGFDVDVPWERLSIFTRHMDSAAPIPRVPVFALAEFGLTSASSAALDDSEAEARIAFPKLPLGVVGTDHVGYGSFDLWPLRNVTVLQSLKTSLLNAGMLVVGRPRLKLNLSKLLVLPYKDSTIAFNALTEGDIGPESCACEWTWTWLCSRTAKCGRRCRRCKRPASMTGAFRPAPSRWPARC